ncbi:hypothetical protein CHARACLAT_031436, partial [Characodon lateralis]|nr:hypothetical protein [Characodon lateralis]
GQQSGERRDQSFPGEQEDLSGSCGSSNRHQPEPDLPLVAAARLRPQRAEEEGVLPLVHSGENHTRYTKLLKSLKRMAQISHESREEMLRKCDIIVEAGFDSRLFQGSISLESLVSAWMQFLMTLLVR